VKRKRFTEEQITYALRQVLSGVPVMDVCRPSPNPTVSPSRPLRLRRVPASRRPYPSALVQFLSYPTGPRFVTPVRGATSQSVRMAGLSMWLCFGRLCPDGAGLT
jgi:hypothetical protein